MAQPAKRFKVIEKGQQRVALTEMNPNFTFFVEDREARSFTHFTTRKAARSWAATKNAEAATPNPAWAGQAEPGDGI